MLQRSEGGVSELIKGGEGRDGARLTFLFGHEGADARAQSATLLVVGALVQLE